MQPFDGRGPLDDRVGVVLREVAHGHFVSPLHRAAINLEICAPHRRYTRLRCAISDFSRVVLPEPLRPVSAIFSPRSMAAVNVPDHLHAVVGLVTLLNSSGCRPEGTFMSKRMYGRAIFDCASSEV